MKTNFIYRSWLLLAIMALPFVYLASMYPTLPDTVPYHFGEDGQPDRYGSKWGLIWIFGGMTLLLFFLLQYIPAIDPKQNLNTSNYYKMRLLIALFWAGILTMVWYAIAQGATGETLMSYILASTGILVAGVGNLMYSLRPNFFVGIRTPWTLSSETVWRRTHQKAAPVWVTGGLLAALLALVIPTPVKVWAVVGTILIVALWSVVYSYWLFAHQRQSA